jgi:Na+-transporting NADH:ubiquinone oxidoreductase subunit NqrD
MSIHAYGYKTGPGGEPLNRKTLFAILAPLLVVVASAFAMTLAVSSAVTPVAATSPMQNVTLLIDDFIPAFMNIMIVMIFVLLLLVLVDRVAKHI